MTLNAPSIWSYYQNALEALRAAIERTSDRHALSYTAESWAESLLAESALLPIKQDPNREPELEETVDNVMRYRYWVLPNPTLHKFVGVLQSGRIFTNSRISEIKYLANIGCLYIDAPQDHFPWKLEFFRDAIAAWNSDINAQNQTFAPNVRRFIDQRIERAKKNRQQVGDFMKATGIKLRKKEPIANIVPIEVPVRKEISPVLKKIVAEEQLTLDRDTLNGILFLIENQGRQFERTPNVFARLVEEDLRDVLLSSLNAVFGDQAVGEAFQGIGKTDIHLRVAKGELFVAECKKWTGPDSLREATEQLLGQLTWHESHGIVLFFNYDRSDFGRIRETIEASIPSLSGVAGAVRRISERELACAFDLPSDTTRRVELRFLAYNLFTATTSKRSRPRKGT